MSQMHRWGQKHGAALSLTWGLDGVGSQRQTSVALPQGKNSLYQFYMSLAVSRSMSRSVRKIFLPPGFENRIFQPVASQSWKPAAQNSRGREFPLRDILHKKFCSFPPSNSLEQISEQMKKVSGKEGGMGMTVRVAGESLIRRNSH